MRLGVLSDIHANADALAAVLAQARQCGVERLLFLGDLIGYYYRPLEVLELLEEWPLQMIQGNHERMLAAAAKTPDEAERIQERYGSGITEALLQLTAEQVAMFAALPARKEVVIEGVRILLCHGSPWNPDEYIYPDAPGRVLERCAEEGQDFILMGHTHWQFTCDVGGNTVINPGSVGQARDEGGLAKWAIVSLPEKEFTLQQTAYDPSRLAEEARSTDPDKPYLSEVLQRPKQEDRRMKSAARQHPTGAMDG